MAAAALSRSSQTSVSPTAMIATPGLRKRGLTAHVVPDGEMRTFPPKNSREGAQPGVHSKSSRTNPAIAPNATCRETLGSTARQRLATPSRPHRPHTSGPQRTGRIRERIIAAGHKLRQIAAHSPLPAMKYSFATLLLSITGLLAQNPAGDDFRTCYPRHELDPLRWFSG